MQKIERPTDKILKEQLDTSIGMFWIFILAFIVFFFCGIFADRIDVLIISIIFIILAVTMKVLKILDKIRLEIRGV